MGELSVDRFHRILIVACAAASCCVLSASNMAGELGKASLSEKPIEVLGGRLTVHMPDRASIQARPFVLMSAPEWEEHETRVIFDAGQEKLFLVVQESFAFAGDDFEKDVRDWVAKWKGEYRIEPMQLPTKGLIGVAVNPRNVPDHSRYDDATFVEGVFLVSHDRTIQSFDVCVNAAAEKDMEGCRAIGDRILRSVAPGKKKLRLGPGERRLAFSKDMEISILVPKDTAVIRQVGPDFLIQRLIVLGRLGAESGRIGIYLGAYPEFQAGTTVDNGTIFGKKVEWHSLPDRKGLETLCKPPIPDDIPLMAQVWVQAANDAQLGLLKQAAESMKLVKVKESASR
jgi:hypothetical protein